MPEPTLLRAVLMMWRKMGMSRVGGGQAVVVVAVMFEIEKVFFLHILLYIPEIIFVLVGYDIEVKTG